MSHEEYIKAVTELPLDKKAKVYLRWMNIKIWHRWVLKGSRIHYQETNLISFDDFIDPEPKITDNGPLWKEHYFAQRYRVDMSPIYQFAWRWYGGYDLKFLID